MFWCDENVGIGRDLNFVNPIWFPLTAAMIKDNHNNCALFAQAVRLDWLIQRLESQQASKG